MNEQLLTKVRKLYQNEKFKLDAFFFCGSPTGTPNEGLIEACERYLEAAQRGGTVDAEAAALIAEMETAACRAQQEARAADTADSRADIGEILVRKEELY
ncbi:MAG: hypothetical protein LUE24_13635 [Lachnospiraceae bacterium]|nr:hypothetical protein [Lachnospiraceae bacterium]